MRHALSTRDAFTSVSGQRARVSAGMCAARVHCQIAAVQWEEAARHEGRGVRGRRDRECACGQLTARRVPVKSGLHVVGLWYGLAVPAGLHARTSEKIAETLAAHECLVQREKPVRRQVNVRPFLKELRLAPDTGWLDIGLHLTPAGTARPDDLDLPVVALNGDADLAFFDDIGGVARVALADDDVALFVGFLGSGVHDGYSMPKPLIRH